MTKNNLTKTFSNQFAEIIQDLHKRKLSAIKNKFSPSYIVVSKEMYTYLKRIGGWIMEDELICYYGRWIRKSELKYKTEATNTISNKYRLSKE